MGKPGWGNAQSPITEYIGDVEQTRGTETSQYLEEEKEISMPLVAASERGRAQTESSMWTAVLAGSGLWGSSCRSADLQIIAHREWNVLESSATAGNSPVHESRADGEDVPEYYGTRGTL
jgi:hypothetical protein